MPTLSWWERVTAVIGASGVDDNAAALTMTLEPKRPTAKWFRAIEGSLSAPAFVAQATGPVPVVDRVRDWQDGSALVSGPVTDRLGLVAAGSWRRLSHVEAPNTERDERSRGIRIRASDLCGDPAGRDPRARLGPAVDDGRSYG